MRLVLVVVHWLLVECVHGVSIGIDLGTSNSCVAVVRDGGKCEMVQMHEDGAINLPSVCAVEGKAGDGVHALVSYCSNDEGIFVTGWKRALGLNAKSASWRLSKREAQALHLDTSETTHDGLVALRPPGTNLRVAPQACTECLLRELIERTEKALGEKVDKAVIGVPASYLPAQRAAVEKAAINIGLTKVKLANEPELAAHAYGHEREENAKEATLLVFDLGGGTLDVSLVAVGGPSRTMEVLATAGDPCLGGIDFTRALAIKLGLSFDDKDISISKLLEIRKQNSDTESTPFEQAEDLKIALAFQDDVKLNENTIATRQDLEAAAEIQLREAAACVRRAAIIASVTLEGDVSAFPGDESSGLSGGKKPKKKKKKKSSKQQFNDNIRDIRERLPKGQVLRRWPSAADARTIDDVILVGAATRMPCIPRMLSRLTRLSVAIRPDIDPEHAVAKGAAIRAAMNDQRLDDFVVFDAWQAQVLRHFSKKEATKRQYFQGRKTQKSQRLVTVRGPNGERETILVEDDTTESAGAASEEEF